MRSRWAWAASVLLAMGLSSPASADAEPIVAVTVTNVQPAQGDIYAALYDQRGFSDPVARMRVPATGDAVQFQFTAPGPGRYAIRLFHDLDADAVMDVGIIGMPLEPVGFSNDASIQFGPPSFEASAFAVSQEGAAVTIALH